MSSRAIEQQRVNMLDRRLLLVTRSSMFYAFICLSMQCLGLCHPCSSCSRSGRTGRWSTCAVHPWTTERHDPLWVHVRSAGQRPGQRAHGIGSTATRHARRPRDDRSDPLPRHLRRGLGLRSRWPTDSSPALAPARVLAAGTGTQRNTQTVCPRALPWWSTCRTQNRDAPSSGAAPLACSGSGGSACCTNHAQDASSCIPRLNKVESIDLQEKAEAPVLGVTGASWSRGSAATCDQVLLSHPPGLSRVVQLEWQRAQSPRPLLGSFGSMPDASQSRLGTGKWSATVAQSW